MQDMNFKLNFLKLEDHLILPRITSMVVVQNLYDVLFQYAITEEKEQKIKAVIDLMETHVKSKTRAPFSIPAAELDFLEEAWEELNLLNWLKMPLALFQVELTDGTDQIDSILEFLETLFTYKFSADTLTLFVYPANLTIY